MRLLPAVACAATALLALKAIGLADAWSRADAPASIASRTTAGSAAPRPGVTLAMANDPPTTGTPGAFPGLGRAVSRARGVSNAPPVAEDPADAALITGSTPKPDGAPAAGANGARAPGDPTRPGEAGAERPSNERTGTERSGTERAGTERPSGDPRGPGGVLTQIAPPSRPYDPDRPLSASPAERRIAERLGERRGALEERARELDMREKLLQSTERRIESRLDELRDVETRADDGATQKRREEAAALKNLILMYETMKPKDAARVFDRLDHKVLVPVVSQMNPRKMAEILAAMSAEAAERLTVALATRETAAPVSTPASLPPGELQRIEVPTAARPAP